jgi:hypothetical protein
VSAIVALAALLGSCGKSEPASGRKDPGLLFHLQTALAGAATDSHNELELKALASREAKNGPVDSPSPGREGITVAGRRDSVDPAQRFVARSTEDGGWRIYDQVAQQDVGDPSAVLDEAGAEEAAATLNASEASDATEASNTSDAVGQADADGPAAATTP